MMTRYKGILFLIFLMGLPALPRSLRAQAPDSVGPPPNRAQAPPRRAAWLTDERIFRIGDLITVVVDERVSARERTSKVATDARNQSASFSSAGLDPLPGSLDFATGLDQRSRSVGEASRQGDLAAVLSVRVTEVDSNGNLRIQGERYVTIDGRKQEVAIEGWVRSQDVSAENFISSSRIADATIRLKGKMIGPSKGILGKILSIFWP